MNYEKYTNTLPCPQKNFFFSTVKAVAPDGSTHEVRVLNEDKWKKANKAYDDEEVHIWNQFCTDLKVELGITDHPRADSLIKKAVECSPSASYQDIGTWAFNLVELIK